MVECILYVCNDHGSTSWLDRCVCTEIARESVITIKVLHNYVISNHIPILCTLNENNPGSISSTMANSNVDKWEKLSDTTVYKYQRIVSTLLSEIVIPYLVRMHSPRIM